MSIPHRMCCEHSKIFTRTYIHPDVSQSPREVHIHTYICRTRVNEVPIRYQYKYTLQYFSCCRDLQINIWIVFGAIEVFQSISSFHPQRLRSGLGSAFFSFYCFLRLSLFLTDAHMEKTIANVAMATVNCCRRFRSLRRSCIRELRAGRTV